MPIYKVREKQTGEIVRFNWKPATAPTESDMEEVFAQARSRKVSKISNDEVPEIAKKYPTLYGLYGATKETAKAVGRATLAVPETLAMGVKGLLDYPLTTLSGVAKTITSGRKAGEETERQVGQALYYEPYSPEAKQTMEMVGKAFHHLGWGPRKAGEAVSKYISPEAGYITEKGLEYLLYGLIGKIGAKIPTIVKGKPSWEKGNLSENLAEADKIIRQGTKLREEKVKAGLARVAGGDKPLEKLKESEARVKAERPYDEWKKVFDDKLRKKHRDFVERGQAKSEPAEVGPEQQLATAQQTLAEIDRIMPSIKEQRVISAWKEARKNISDQIKDIKVQLRETKGKARSSAVKTAGAQQEFEARKGVSARAMDVEREKALIQEAEEKGAVSGFYPQPERAQVIVGGVPGISERMRSATPGEPAIQTPIDTMGKRLEPEPESSPIPPTKSVSPELTPKTTIKEQKTYLFGKIDEAIAGVKGKEVAEPGTVTIQIPGDGKFNIRNTEDALTEFKRMAKRFPDSVVPGSKEARAINPKGKRIALEDVEYYNEFKSRKQQIITNKEKPNYYKDGWFSNGHYLIKAEKPKGITTQTEDIRGLLPPKTSLEPAEIKGEFNSGRKGSIPMAHVESSSGHGVYNAHYIDVVLTKYPKAKAYVNEDNKMLVFYSDEKPVAASMPLKDGEELLIPFKDRITELKETEGITGLIQRIGKTLGERGAVGRDIGQTPEQTAARQRILKDIDKIQENAKRVGKNIEDYLKGLGADDALAKQIGKYVAGLPKKEEKPPVSGQGITPTNPVGISGRLQRLMPGYEAMKDIKSGIQSLVAPTTKSPEHLRAGEIIGAKLGAMNRRQEISQYALRKAQRLFDKMGLNDKSIVLSENKGVKFMSDVSQGRKQPNELLQATAVIKKAFDLRVALVQQLGKGALETVRENYFPGIWKEKIAPEQMLSKRPFEGKASFLKPKVFDDIMDGIHAGYTPVSNNPIDLVRLKLAEMDRYIMAHQTIKEFKGKGDIVYQKGAFAKPPAGWSAIHDKYGTVKYRNESGEWVISGHYIAREPVADVLNNYLSSNLYNNRYFGKLYKGYMAAGNALNQAQLGVFSAFHVGFTAGDVQVSAGATVFKDIYGVAKGNRSIRDLAHTWARYPQATIRTPIEGSSIIREWREPGITNNPKVAQIARAAELAGVGFKLEHGLRTEQTGKMISDWTSGKRLKAVARSPIVFIEQAAKPIMEFLVPRQKAGVFGEMAGRIIEQNPGIPLENLTTEFRQIGNRVDARLGQVQYSRYFANNVAKNIVQGLVRAPGWTGGSILELGGGVKDAGIFIKDWIQSGKAPENLPDRVAYVLSLATTVAITNGILTAAFTGETPKGMDFLAFRDGGKDEYGRETRMVLPSYAKDVYAFLQNPAHTLSAKTHPLISAISDVIRNKDYYGREIGGPTDKALYAVKQFIPFWVRGVRKAQEQHGMTAKTLLPLIGIMPASGMYTGTKIQNDIGRLYDKRFGGGTAPASEKEAKEAKRKIRTTYQRGDTKEANRLLKEAEKKGYLKEEGVSRFIQSADIPGDVNMFKRLPKSDQETLLKNMSLEEIRRYAWYAHKDVKATLGKLSENAATFVGRFMKGQELKPEWKQGKTRKQSGQKAETVKNMIVGGE